jgi:Entericidin EcnA/B family.
MKTITTRIVLAVFVAMLTVAATGCRSTAHGAGEDIENMGEEIQDAVK